MPVLLSICYKEGERIKLIKKPIPYSVAANFSTITNSFN